MTYYIYEVPGHKNGATIDWKIRSYRNFTRYDVHQILIETMEGPDDEDMWQIVGDREWELADLNGYRRGDHYRNIRTTQLRSCTEEVKRKISDTLSGTKFTEEHSARISNSLKGISTAGRSTGYTHTEETKQHLSEIKKGTKLSKDHRLSISKSSRTVPIEIVREIKAKYVPYKYSAQMLAEEYGISYTRVSNIIKNITYAEIE